MSLAGTPERLTAAFVDQATAHTPQFITCYDTVDRGLHVQLAGASSQDEALQIVINNIGAPGCAIDAQVILTDVTELISPNQRALGIHHVDHVLAHHL